MFHTPGKKVEQNRAYPFRLGKVVDGIIDVRAQL